MRFLGRRVVDRGRVWMALGSTSRRRPRPVSEGRAHSLTRLEPQRAAHKPLGTFMRGMLGKVNTTPRGRTSHGTRE